MHKVIFLLLFIATAVQAFGQGFLPQVWNEHSIITFMPGNPAEVWFENDKGQVWEAHLPDKARLISLDYFEGNFYCSKYERQGETKFHNVFMSSDLKSWTKVAFYSIGTDYPGATIRPLGDGYFLVMSQNPRRVGGEWCSFFIGKANESGRIQADTPVDLKLNQWLYRPTTLQDNTQFCQVNEIYTTIPNVVAMDPIYRVGGKLVIGSLRHGALWILDCHSRKITRKLLLNPFIEENKLFTDNIKPQCILGIQPMRDGRLLIATRCKEALSATPMEPQVRSLMDFQNAGIREAAENNEALDRKFYPAIDWWTLDPETGKLDPEGPPMNFPTSLGNLGHEEFKFRFKVDENLTTKPPVMPELGEKTKMTEKAKK